MKLYRNIWLAGLIALAACGQKMGEPPAQEPQEQHAKSTTSVSLSNAQIKTAAIVIGAIEMKNLNTSISVNGTLAVPNQNKAVITSLVGGTLQNLKVQPGDFVKKGQIIGTIANTELSSLQQQLISITAQANFAEQELTRQQELVAGNAAPLKNLQKAESELNGLRAQQSALKHQLQALGVSSTSRISSSLVLTAPLSGTVSEIDAQIGSQINANSPIAQVINNSELHLDLFIYEKDLPKVATGQTIHFTLTNSPGKEYDAIIYSIGTAFVKETKAIPIHAKVVNEKTGLIEGMSVTARISLGDKVYPAVPDDAVVNDGGKDYIFVVIGKTRSKTANTLLEDTSAINFERVAVIRGASDVGYTEIKPITEIPTDAWIVTKGAFFLMAKMTNTGDEE